MPRYTLNINGADQTLDVEPDMSLLWALRDTLGLIGTKYGCGIAQCGACTVHVNGTAMRSCVTTVSIEQPVFCNFRTSSRFGYLSLIVR